MFIFSVTLSFFLSFFFFLSFLGERQRGREERGKTEGERYR